MPWHEFFMGGQGPSKPRKGKADRDDGQGGGKRQKVIRCHNQSGFLQRSIRCTWINTGLRLSHREGAKSPPELELPWDQSWLGAVGLIPWPESPLGRQEQKERQGQQCKEVFLASPQQGVSSSRSILQGTRYSQSHLRHAPVGLALKSYQPWSGRKVCSCVAKMLCASLKCRGLVSMVLAFTGQGIDSWGSWLMEPKPVYKVGFIREKGKAIARACSGSWKPVVHCSG
jgi:hypothetical protein